MNPKIYGFAPSTYTQTALMVAAECGLELEPSPLEFKQPSHFALHPYGKMPVLEHGELRLFETLAIASYLDRQFGDSKLSPRDPINHARMLQWVSVAIDYAYEDLVNGLHGDAPSKEARAAAREQLTLIAGGLAPSPYLAGEELSLADLFMYPMIEFAAKKLGPTGLSGLPAIESWRRALSKQKSASKVV